MPNLRFLVFFYEGAVPFVWFYKWGNSLFILFRSELTQFLEEQRDSAVRRGESDPAFGAEFKYSAHINELVVGTVYLRNTVKLTKKMRLLYLLYFNMI